MSKDSTCYILDSDTPWWHKSPSLTSQANHMTTYTSGECSITPRSSSGYYEEDDGSNVSDGSYGAAGQFSMASASNPATHQRTESNTTLTNGQLASYQVQVKENTTESSRDSGTVRKPTSYTLNAMSPKSTKPPLNMGRGIGGITPQPPGHGVRTRGVPVAPMELEGGRSPAKAFSNTPTKEEAFVMREPTSHQQRKDYENAVSDPSSHSMSAANKDILHYLRDQFMQNINSMDLLPHLKQYNLLGDEDIDYIYNPNNTERDKIKRILHTVPFRDTSDAFEKFVKCFEADGDHEAHTYLARRLREAMEMKRQAPFKRLSSPRGHQSHTHGHTHTSSRQAPQGDRGGGGWSRENTENFDPRRLGGSDSAPPPHQITPSPKTTPTRSDNRPQVPPKLKRHNKTLSSGSDPKTPLFPPTPPVPPHRTHLSKGSDLSQSMDPIFSPPTPQASNSPSSHPYGSRGQRRQPYDKVRYNNYNPAPGNYSSLPRTHSKSSSTIGGISAESARGTKPYSSARFPSSTTAPSLQQASGTPEKRRIPLSRNASFHGTGDQHITVAPMDRNPMMLSEETDDDSYLYRKSATNTGMQIGVSKYENVTRRAHDLNSSRRASLDNGVQSHSSPKIRRPSDEATQVIAGIVSPVPMATSFSRRTHEVIMEDPSAAAPVPEWEPNPESFMGTFPRQVPSRSQSMNVRGDTRMRMPHQQFALPQQEQESVKKTACLRRGASLHGPADMYPAEVRMKAKTLDLRQFQPEGEGDNDVVPELMSSTLPRQHRRTHSYDNTQPAPHKNMDTFKKRTSEHFPAPREELEVSFETSTAEVSEATAASPSSSAASPSAQDLHQQQKMFKKKVQWLQQKVKFTDFSEELKFDSLTRYHTSRSITYSGTLYEKGKPRFVILLTDMLLILKPKKKSGKLGQRQQTFIDWFTEIDCKTKRPLMLHLLSIQGKSRRAFSESFNLHYNRGSSLMKLTLYTVSKEAKDIWLDHLADAIRVCTTANAECTISTNRNVGKLTESSSHTLLTLTIVEANNIAYSANVTTKNHYCNISLGELRCRTPSVKAKCWPTWNYKCTFSDFNLEDTLRIDFFTESITCPDDFLGYVKVDLQSASQKHQTQQGVTQMHLKKQHLPLKDGKGTLTVDFELKWEHPHT